MDSICFIKDETELSFGDWETEHEEKSRESTKESLQSRKSNQPGEMKDGRQC